MEDQRGVKSERRAKILSCGFGCGKAFKDKASLGNHRSNAHPELEQFMPVELLSGQTACPVCDKEFKLKNTCSVHIKVKHLGLVDRFNGVDVKQTREYVKIYNNTYITKLEESHPWLEKFDGPVENYPIPMRAETDYRKQLESAVPATPDELKQLQKEFGFKTVITIHSIQIKA